MNFKIVIYLFLIFIFNPSHSQNSEKSYIIFNKNKIEKSFFEVDTLDSNRFTIIKIEKKKSWINPKPILFFSTVGTFYGFLIGTKKTDGHDSFSSVTDWKKVRNGFIIGTSVGIIVSLVLPEKSDKSKNKK